MKTLIILLISLLMFNCKSTKDISISKIPKDPELIATIGEFPTSSEPIAIDSIQIIGNKMLINVTYKGGCGNHNFKLIGSQQIAKSIPPIRNIKLFHTIENDNCKRLITRVLHFDISELAYKKENGNEIYLTIDGYKEKLKYTFE